MWAEAVRKGFLRKTGFELGLWEWELEEAEKPRGSGRPREQIQKQQLNGNNVGKHIQVMS